MLALSPPSSPPGKAAISAASSPASKLQKINIPLTVILNASSPYLRTCNCLPICRFRRWRPKRG